MTSINRTELPKGTLLTIDGDIDDQGVDILRAELYKLAQEQVLNIYLDLDASRFISYVGVGVLVERHESLKKLGGGIRLININLYTERLFRMVGVSNLFETYDHVEQALGSELVPLSEIPDSLIEVVRFVNDEALKQIQANPSLVRELHPRNFEELIAELFVREGCEVELTQPTRDGGVDLHVVKQESFGKWLYLVECKRQKETNPVGVQVVRQLFGEVNHHRANAGIVVTSSYFTKPAIEFWNDTKSILSLKDFRSLSDWIRSLKLG